MQVVDLKDKQIAGLTAEFDGARDKANKFATKIVELETQIALLQKTAATAGAAGSAEQSTASSGGAVYASDTLTLAELRSQSEILKMELRALQEITGMDFVPGKTQVNCCVHIR